MHSICRRFVRDERGQEIVEFALAALIFLMTVFGTLEFGLAVYQYNMVSNLAQEGARWASGRGTTSTLTTASTADVQAFVTGRFPGLSPVVTTVPGSVGAPGTTFSVTVTTSFAPLTSLIPLSTLSLQSTATMVVAG